MTNKFVSFIASEPGGYSYVCSVCGKKYRDMIFPLTGDNIHLEFPKAKLYRETNGFCSALEFNIIISGGEQRRPELSVSNLTFQHGICYRCLASGLLKAAEEQDAQEDVDRINEVDPEEIEASYCIGKRKECTEQFVKEHEDFLERSLLFDPKTYGEKKTVDLYPEAREKLAERAKILLSAVKKYELTHPEEIDSHQKDVSDLHVSRAKDGSFIEGRSGCIIGEEPKEIPIKTDASGAPLLPEINSPMK